MKKVVTTPDRLALLLDWLNDESWKEQPVRWRDGELQTRLDRFISSFDGSKESGYVLAEVGRDDTPSFLRNDAGTGDIDDLDVLHTTLREILASGFEGAKSALPDLLDLRLKFGFARFAPHGLKGKERRQESSRGGSYVLRVAGEPLWLVVWLALHLLRLPGAIELRRCAAPRPYSSDERCGKFLMSFGAGRPRTFCSLRCRQRDFWSRDENGKAATQRRTRRRQRKTYVGAIKKARAKQLL